MGHRRRVDGRETGGLVEVLVDRGDPVAVVGRRARARGRRRSASWSRSSRSGRRGSCRSRGRSGRSGSGPFGTVAGAVQVERRLAVDDRGGQAGRRRRARFGRAVERPAEQRVDAPSRVHVVAVHEVRAVDRDDLVDRKDEALAAASCQCSVRRCCCSAQTVWLSSTRTTGSPGGRARRSGPSAGRRRSQRSL